MNVAIALNLAVELLVQAQKLSALTTAAQLKGKTELGDDEVKQILADRDASFKRLDDAIAKAQTEGR